MQTAHIQIWEKTMEASNVLKNLGEVLASGGVEVIDCSGILGPETPIIQLPADFAKPTPKVEIHKINCWIWIKSYIHIKLFTRVN